MSKTDDHPRVDRRGFLKGVAVAGSAGVAAPGAAKAQAPAAAPKAAPPSTAQQAKENDQPPHMEQLTTEKSGSDFMVDVCKTLNIDYMASCPGSTFRALQESFINYGKNKKPEWLTCLHEEVSVGMAHGYAKVAGKPMACMMHGTVGVQHGAMAMFNAYCDRVPIIMFTASAGPVEDRRPGVEWMHSVQDGAVTVRDFTKWDDYPWSLQSFAESTARAYGLAVAQPPGPVLITADGKLQESELSKAEEKKLFIPKANINTQAFADPAALRDIAKMLVAAENPVIMVDRYARSQEGVDNLVKLAEILQAPVVDARGRMNMPSMHHLCQTPRSVALLGQADFILTLEPVDLFGQLNRVRDQIERSWRRTIKPGTKVVCISTHDLLVKANYQDFQRYSPADLYVTADAQASMPYLIDAVLKEVNGDRKTFFEARGQKMKDAQKAFIAKSREDAAIGWDSSPISGARLFGELWEVVKNEDWAFSTPNNYAGNWQHRLWPLTKHYQYIGGSGGSGVGYEPVAALGAALAHRDEGRLSIGIVGDGNFNMAPHIMWTAAHHKIPMLTIIHNNRAYHQEVMHLQRMANRHNRDVTTASIGTTIENPNIDYAALAKSYGATAFGPVTDPKDLGDTLKKAVAAAKAGNPVLVDAIMQPRG